ncbi:MAG: ribonuclease P protein component [Burkholderiaceae bacterium]
MKPRRSRQALRSEHFELMAVRAEAGSIPGGSRPELWMAVPKRLLKRAVDRNALRRVAREHWRQLPFSDTDERVPARRYLLRLKARPVAFAQSSRPARKAFWHVELADLFGRLVR